MRRRKKRTRQLSKYRQHQQDFFFLFSIAINA
jgi:hypothetical protein